MKKIYNFLALTMIIANASAQQPCKEFFMSEYMDGPNKNKVIEIFNPSDSIKSLNNYSIKIFQNGAPTPIEIPLSGNVNPKETYVVAHPQAAPQILAKANQTDVKMNFDGNDAIVLNKGTSSYIDKIGEIGVNPGQGGWNVPPSGSTKENDLRRKFPIDRGETDWNNGKNQWEVHPKDSVQNIKQHQNNCSAYISNDIDSSNIVFINDTPAYVKNQIIVRFDSSIVNADQVNDGLMKYGNLPVFVKSNAISIIGNKLGNQSLTSLITVKKIFENLKTTDTISISRVEDTITIPPFWATFILSFPDPTDVITVCDSLNDLFPLIVYAEPNYISTLNSAPNDALYSNQACLHYTTSYPNAHINAEAAWNYQVGKGFVKVGVYDTGIQYAHEDFGNGTFQGSKIAGGYDYLGSVPIQNSSYPDPVGHGTSTAGIIGALRNNNLGIAGIAGGDVNAGNTGVQLFAMKIGGSSFAADNVIAQAIVEGATSTNYGLHIMNNSWGGPNASTTIKDAVRFAFNNSVIFVASRGNDGNNSANYPACYRDNWVINVGASGTDGSYKSTTNGDNWWASSYGLNVDVIAPGTTEIVTAPENTTDYIPFNGTSSAAPHVSGSAALMLSHYNLPYSSTLNLAPEDVENILQSTAVDKGAWGYDDYNGWGLINTANALNYVNKPFFEVKHIKISISAASILQSNVVRTLSGNFNGLAAGDYFVNVYQYSYTYNFNYDLNPNKVLWGDWARNSSSNLWANSNPIVPETNIFEQSYTNNTVIVRGYIYKIISNIIGQQINQWVPFDPASIKGQLAFTLHIYDPNAVSVNEKNIDNNSSLNIYPNPANNSASIVFSISEMENIEIELRNIAGSIVQTFPIGRKEPGTFSFDIPLYELPSGVYFVKLKSIEKSVFKKLVIVH